MSDRPRIVARYVVLIVIDVERPDVVVIHAVILVDLQLEHVLADRRVRAGGEQPELAVARHRVVVQFPVTFPGVPADERDDPRTLSDPIVTVAAAGRADFPERDAVLSRADPVHATGTRHI